MTVRTSHSGPATGDARLARGAIVAAATWRAGAHAQRPAAAPTQAASTNAGMGLMSEKIIPWLTGAPRRATIRVEARRVLPRARKPRTPARAGLRPQGR